MRRILVAAAAAGLLMVHGVATGGVASALPAEPDDSGCVSGRWPAVVQGRPESFAPHGAKGIYVWHDERGWHLGVTHDGEGPVVFEGRISVNGRLLGVERRTEGRDEARITHGHRQIGFRFVNWGWIDGVDFVTRCTDKIVVSASIDGSPVTPDQVFVGREGTHPPRTPFVIKRVSSDDVA